MANPTTTPTQDPPPVENESRRRVGPKSKKDKLLDAILATFPQLRASGTGAPKYPKIEKAVEANRLNRHAGDIFEAIAKEGVGEGTIAKIKKFME